MSKSFIKTDQMEPFRHFLSQSQLFLWDIALESGFKRSKEKIIEGLVSFDVNLSTCLQQEEIGLDPTTEDMFLQEDCANVLCRWMDVGDGWKSLLQPGRMEF